MNRDDMREKFSPKEISWEDAFDALRESVTGALEDPYIVAALAKDRPRTMQAIKGWPADDFKRVAEATLNLKHGGEGPKEIPDKYEAGIEPEGWKLSADGIYQSTKTKDGWEWKQRTFRPVWISRRIIPISGNGSVWLELNWTSSNGSRVKRCVQRGEVMDSRALAKLAHHGAPVSSDNCRYVVKFLEAHEAANELATARYSSKMGWIGTEAAPMKHGFLLGDACYGGEAIFLNDGARDHTVGIEKHGKWKDWVEMTKLLPEAGWAMIMCALAAPAVALVKDGPNLFADFASESGHGKTSCLSAAISVMGNPDRTKSSASYSWDTTPVGVEQVLGFRQCLPMYMDDSKQARRKEDIGTVMYAVGNGQGRIRGRADGGVRDVQRWRACCISTGEQAAVEYTDDAGAHARVLTFSQPPWAKSAQNGQLAGEVERLSYKTYGHAMPKAVLWLQQQGVEAVAVKYKELRENWELDLEGTAGGSRAARLVAAVGLGEWVAKGIGLKPPDLYKYLMESAQGSAEGVDRPAIAFEMVLQWADSNDDRFIKPDDPRRPDSYAPSRGWAGQRTATEVQFYRHVLIDVMRELGISDGKARIKSWVKNGQMNVEAGRTDRKVTINGSRKNRAYCLYIAGFAPE